MARRTEAAAGQVDGLSLQHLILQFLLLYLTFHFWSTPLLQPVKVMVVLFHEISHGLMAITTGGKVLSIVITPGEGGACETEGGAPLAIVSAGYLGSMFFGGVILFLSRTREFVALVFGLLTMLLLAAIVTVLADSFSKRFAASLAAVFAVLAFIAPPFLGALALRVLGTVSCLYSIFDIYWDVLARRGSGELQNDAAVFSALSGVDVQVVGGTWLAVCVAFFLVVLRLSLRTGGSSGAGLAGAKASAA